MKKWGGTLSGEAAAEAAAAEAAAAERALEAKSAIFKVTQLFFYEEFWRAVWNFLLT